MFDRSLLLSGPVNIVAEAEDRGFSFGRTRSGWFWECDECEHQDGPYPTDKIAARTALEHVEHE